MNTLKKSFNELGMELSDVFADAEAQLKNLPAAKTRTSARRIPRGKKTPEDAYREPILKALIELGGKGTTSEVLDKVYEQMKDVFNQYDKQPVPSVPSQQRWRHTAQIVRNKMMNEGFVKKNSPRGVWEISAAGTKTIEPKKPPKKSTSTKKSSSSNKSTSKSKSQSKTSKNS